MGACDEARRLLARAAEDEYVLDRLPAEAPEAVVGFHAPQAAEKLLKVLTKGEDALLSIWTV